MDSNPIHHPSPAKEWNAHFWIMFNFWWSVGLVNGLKPHLQPLSSQKSEMLIFGLRSTSYDWPAWSMDSNPICKLSPTNKMKCLFLVYIQLLMIIRAGRWTQTPSVTPLQPKKWNACFCIMLYFWWSAGLVDGLEPHLPPLSSQKSEMLIFVLHLTSDDWPGWSLDSNTIPLPSQAKKNEMLIFGLHLPSDDQPGWSMDSNPICHLSPGIKWNAHFCITFNLWWLAGLVNGLKPHLPPLSSQKNEMLIFGLRWTSDDWLGWWMDSNCICHPSPTKKMKWPFLDSIQLLMIGQVGQWTQTPSATLLQPKKWNACFWIMFNFWWSAGLVNGFKPHPPPISSQKNEMLIFGLLSISGDQPGWSMDSNPIHHPSAAKKWNAHFWITFNFWWSVRLVNRLGSHLPPLSNKKNDMLIFGLRLTSYDWPGWSMDSNPICNPSPTKKMKCSFLDYVQLLMIGQFNFWWSARLVKGLQPHLQPLSNQKNEMLIFVLCSNSGDQPSWSMDSNPICHPSPTKQMKCLFCIML